MTVRLPITGIFKLNMNRTEATVAVPGDLVVVRHSGSCEFTRVSPRYAERLGFTGEELSSEPALDWVHPEDQAAFRRVLDAGVGTVRARHRTKDSEWMQLELRVRTSASGLAVLGLACSEEAVQVESRPLRIGGADGSLADILAMMARIVEAKNPGMMCSILLVDESGERVSVGAGPSFPDEYNAAVEGLQIGPTVGSCGTAAFWNIPVVVENIYEDPLWRDLREAAKIAGVSACWSHPITTTSGDVLGAMALYDRVPNAPDKHQMDGLEIAARMVGMAVERDRLEEQLRQGAKMEALGVLAGGIAHDFNNMLAAVLGNAELALQFLPADAPSKPMLTEIAVASVSAAELCSQMLAYAGRGAMAAQTIDCNPLIRELGALLQVALAKKAELRYELSTEAMFILADRSQLRQVIMNLITNASEAIGNNEGVIGIGTVARELTREDLNSLPSGRALEPGEYVELWVSDTGAGMAATTRVKMFDPFFTTKSTGRGLGLAAVQGIVRSHHGAINLDGGHGEGTRFSILLPRVAEPELVETAVAEERIGSGDANILVVDDEDAVRNIVSAILESAGYTVLLARDGQEALEIFRRKGNDIDCVLLDLSMPKLDGDEVFQELKKIRSDVRVILSSGFTEQQVLSRFQDAGLAGVLQKPTRMKDLLDKVAEALA